MSFSNPKQKLVASRDKLISWCPTIGFLLHCLAIVLSATVILGYFFGDVSPDKSIHLTLSALLVLIVGNQLVIHYGNIITHEGLVLTLDKLDRLEGKVEQLKDNRH